ncbi:glycoprotein Xg isoform X2 [Neophocaena asiaeorientalis asiaeorientalis]|uniref:Glycoprotein Xg isoform X2 n=1 Tax=Neophocaena asiaeorientalis asiaeorientalis TaxID=1706337 RepID=A0A341CDS3_NEOAA|nr:glycoprotein Xg isoform X2 [Neophocaena asiaeorientalis asiaeorientalis]
MTPSPPRSRAQISTQSRRLPTSHSPEIPTAVEVRKFIHFKASLMKDIYPRPKPPPRPQPGSSDNGAGGDGYPSYGNPQGNRIAKIVSPVLCGVLVTLVGATTSYFRYNRKRNCCRTNEPENV